MGRPSADGDRPLPQAVNAQGVWRSARYVLAFGAFLQRMLASHLYKWHRISEMLLISPLATCMTHHVLLDRLEPFDQDPLNPSWGSGPRWTGGSLQLCRAGDALRGASGAVALCLWRCCAGASAGGHRAVAAVLVICLGLAGGRSGHTRQVAINVDDARIPRQRRPPACGHGGAVARAWPTSTLPIKAMVRNLRIEAFGVCVQHGGHLYCNHVFMR